VDGAEIAYVQLWQLKVVSRNACSHRQKVYFARWRVGVLLLVAISFDQVLGFVPPYENEKWKGWKITRHDYVDFCNGNSIEISLADGSLHGSLGTCAPDLNKPSKQIEAQVSKKNLTDLRDKIRTATRNGGVSANCAAVPGPRILPGPVSLEISRSTSQAKIETLFVCTNAGERNVFRAFEQAVAPLHRFGFRRWI
jgi:hypothetical protein